MPWKKGQSGNPEGRKHGQLNKMTVAMKEAMEVSFEKQGKAKFLNKLAEESPEAYARLLAKFIPLQVQAELEPGDVTINVISGIEAGPPGSAVKK